MNKEMIKLYYFYKSGAIDSVIEEKRINLDKNKKYQKSLKQFKMRHVEELKLPAEMENIVYKIICKKYIQSSPNEEVIINAKNIFNFLKSQDLFMRNEKRNTKRYKDISKNEAEINVKSEMDILKKNMHVKSDENIKNDGIVVYKDKEIEKRNKKYIELNYYNLVVSYLFEAALDIINKFFPISKVGLPSLDLIIEIINMIIDKKDLEVTVNKIRIYRTLDQYGIVSDLKIAYLIEKLESLGLNVMEEMSKDGVEDKIYDIIEILNKKEYMYLKYDSDLYQTRNKPKGKGSKSDSEDLRKEISNAIKIKRDVDKDFYGIDVDNKGFNTYISYVDNLVNHVNRTFPMQEDVFYRVKKELFDYTEISKISKIKF